MKFGFGSWETPVAQGWGQAGASGEGPGSGEEGQAGGS